ncbi:MAG: diguanylate cyclase [Actinoplanes sp.]|nr:diguanylate cyclase [Actinoplanes sp.]
MLGGVVQVRSAKSFNDDATDRRLRLLVGLVVVLALSCSCGYAWFAITYPVPPPPLWVLALICAAVAVANRVKVYVRIRSSLDAVYWGEAPVLIGLIVAPAPWVILCSAISMTVIKVITRTTPQKAAFAVAKDVLIASTAALIFAAWGVQPDLGRPSFPLLAIVTAYCGMSIVDLFAFWPVIAVASGSTIRRVAALNWDVKLVGQLVRMATIVLALAIISYGDILLLAVVPLLVACIHLWHSRRVSTREERSSWQRLAKTTDELNAVDLTEVLHSAATRAAQIFSADEAEIDLSAAGTDRIVRAGSETVSYDGPASTATDRPTDDAVNELVTHDGSQRLGVLRLRIGGQVNLTEFEQYKFKTFASALCTAIRNAQAYAELERISTENAYAATHDPLTGLANRRKLYEIAGGLFSTRTNDGILALLLIDLNHFKEVNDTLGHAAGDEVLREVARRLRQTAGSSDDLVARLGGDEFAVLMTKLPTPAMASHRAEAMLAALDRSIEVDGMQLTVEAAGGIALAPGSGGIEELMRRADVAMYQAKRSGTRTANYAHARDTADVGRLTLGTDLRRALDNQEFVVDFQPIVDLGTGEVVSAEALAGWQHPQHGNLTPMQFLETVERSGQLAAFAGAVLDQSLAALETWHEAGFDLPVAVNVSPRSLLDPQFPQAVLDRLTRHAVSPDRLVLELAETLTISQLDVVERTLGRLSDAGVRLALDSFGTGVSSLSVLSRLPVHELKIDREFVLAVETSSEAAAVIRSTVDLGRSLHLTVVAEGVESEPQRQALFNLGCVAGQGHLFARPMRSGRFLATLQRGSAGRPGVLATALHEAGSVVRMPRRRAPGHGRSSLPHLPA